MNNLNYELNLIIVWLIITVKLFYIYRVFKIFFRINIEFNYCLVDSGIFCSFETEDGFKNVKLFESQFKYELSKVTPEYFNL